MYQLQSTAMLPTLREAPKDAETASHILMLRAGMIRKLAAGIYTTMPMGLRVQRKLETIIRQAMNATGAQEVLMPAVIPAELWQESGRWQKYGPELMRIKDRHQRDFVIGPTHEEVITDLVRRSIDSYKALPVNLYQIQSKFRDEVRPRFGVMRGREFLMKDAYSFHLDDADLDQTYRAMHNAYSTIFRQAGLQFVVVDADSGNIGGSRSQEFMVLASTGEDELAHCPACNYAANVEKARRHWHANPALTAGSATEVHTPNRRTIEEVSTYLGIAAGQMLKCVMYESDKGPVMVVVAGDREIQDVKLAAAANVEWIRSLPPEQVQAVTGAPRGFLGPIGLPRAVRLLVDASASHIEDGVTGANRPDYHLRGVRYADLPPHELVDVAKVLEHDPCPQCQKPMRLLRGIEVGHIFKLGTKYSEAMQLAVSAADGAPITVTMGCYGIGVSRTVAAAIEQNHDTKGICWPWALAPWHIHLLELDPELADVQSVRKTVVQECARLALDLLVDERAERPGVKFNDADLIGCPVQIIAGAKALKAGHVEVKHRRSGERENVPVAELTSWLANLAVRHAEAAAR